MINSVEALIDSVDSSVLMSRPLPEWRPLLALECQVYVFGENYLAKRFDQINYKFCEKNEAKEILVDNLYALLRYKYFQTQTEEVDERVNKIVASFTANLKSTLRRVSFDKDSDATVIKMIPDECIAFRNGVYDFKNDKWLFKYDVISLKRICNKIYSYDPQYAIFWYFDFNFEPLPLKISDTRLIDFIEMMKSITKTPGQRNFCFELLYNIAHDDSDRFNLSRFEHLCEILGYTCLQSFSQFFVMLIGSGQNGKNSLFDGCFTHRVVPRPASNDLDAIEQDRFITGSLQNKCQNIFLETSAKTYTESKMIKALTGSMYQTIESKGINKYSGVINCKYVFAGNDQDKIKFSDTTTGFRRRINMFEIYYQWDSHKRFLKRGDYFDTSFSDNLSELKDDASNTIAYVYFAMYGIMMGTKNFTQNFQFTENDWSSKYSDVDVEMKEKIDRLSIAKIVAFLRSDRLDESKTAFYDLNKNRLIASPSVKALGIKSDEELLAMLADPEQSTAFFAEHDVYISVRLIQRVISDINPPTTFTQVFKKLFNITKFEMLNSNRPYVKCTFVKEKLKILQGGK